MGRQADAFPSVHSDSGREACPAGSLPILCHSTFNFSALLQESTACESERISGYADNSQDDCALLALHDLSLEPENKPLEGDSSGENKATSYEELPHSNTANSKPTWALSHQANPIQACKSAPAATPSKNLKAEKPNFSHLRRKKKNASKAALLGQIPSPSVLRKYIKPAAPIASSIRLSSLPASAGAYCARPEGKVKGAQHAYSLGELKEMGFELIPWDGETDRPLVTKEGLVFGALVGRPKDPSYQEAVESAYNFMMEESSRADFTPHEVNHRRGMFPAINVGVTHGKGTLRPVVLDNKQHTAMAERFLSHKGLCRMAGFASASFAAWSPDVYQHYRRGLDVLYKHMPSLKRNFSNSVYPSAGFNLGPRVSTYIHRDVLNCPYGLCAIQPLGNFDPTKGGHIILWELKLVIEFPPGTLILIPSATISHSNVPVSESETRLSFTQYASGGLFRYVDYGFRTEKELKKEDPGLHKKMCQLRPDRWKEGLALLSNIKHLQK